MLKLILTLSVLFTISAQAQPCDKFQAQKNLMKELAVYLDGNIFNTEMKERTGTEGSYQFSVSFEQYHVTDEDNGSEETQELLPCGVSLSIDKKTCDATLSEENFIDNFNCWI